jgi:hypothetical protein
MQHLLPAIEEIDRQISRLTSLRDGLQSLMNGNETTSTQAQPTTRHYKPRRLSVAARKKIAAAQRARWAARKNGNETQAAPSKKGSTQAAYWARMTPGQRRAEMQRRMAQRKAA